MDVRYTIAPYIWWLRDRQVAGMPLPYMAPERLSDPGAAVADYDDDVRVILDAGIRSVISLVNARHSKIFAAAGIDFCAIPIPDGEAPNSAQVEKFREFCKSCREPFAIHCEGGVGRTGTMLALWLVLQGSASEAAIKEVRKVMPTAIETSEQERLLLDYPQAMTE